MPRVSHRKTKRVVETLGGPPELVEQRTRDVVLLQRANGLPRKAWKAGALATAPYSPDMDLPPALCAEADRLAEHARELLVAVAGPATTENILINYLSALHNATVDHRVTVPMWTDARLDLVQSF